MSKSLTILVDSREKIPLIFPSTLTMLSPRHLPHQQIKSIVRLVTKSATLETGDYLLAEAPTACVVERKYSIDELATNTLNPRRRRLFIAELLRLQAYSRPVLLLEGSLSKYLKPTVRTKDPGLALDATQRLLLEYKIGLITQPCNTVAERRAAGEFVARLLVNGALYGNHSHCVLRDGSPSEGGGNGDGNDGLGHHRSEHQQ